MAKAHKTGQTDPHIEASGRVTTLTVADSTVGQIKELTMERGKTIECMVREFTLGQMAGSILDST